MSRVAWILNASIYGFLGLNSARIVAILGAQGLAHNKHSRRALMKRYCERCLELYRRLVAIQAYSVGVAREYRLFVGVHEVADESGVYFGQNTVGPAAAKAGCTDGTYAVGHNFAATALLGSTALRAITADHGDGGGREKASSHTA
ncbi:hypothetical protein B0H13DRAFT_2269394 [Mycena leptocephala]|nr:hypothetical protein B0H13DRAFT_2269394 [Mycena leptocephala]